MRHLALVAVLVVGLTAPAGAGFEDGMAAMARGDYATALEEWRPLAEQGNADAQYNLGLMYYRGQGVPQGYAEAVKWYRKAAEQGHAFAQFSLGGVYHTGRGLPKDYAEAVKWYRKAAEQDFEQAQIVLGMMYSYGSGVPRDPVQAHMWYNILALRSPEEERRGYAKARDALAAHMTPGQIAEARKLAREWKPKAQTAAAIPKASSPRRLPGMPRNTFRDIQESLAALGYDPGPADGIPGPRTGAAIRAFQRDHGLAETGEASADLAERLGVERFKAERKQSEAGRTKQGGK